MNEIVSKPSTSRPAMQPRRQVDPAALKQFAENAGKPEVVIPGTEQDLGNSLEQVSSQASPAVTAALPGAPVVVHVPAKPGHIPYNEKVKPSLFRMTDPQAILLDAVFNRTRYKSKQALYEGEFITRLMDMAKEFAKTDPEMAALLESLNGDKSLTPERRS